MKIRIKSPEEYIARLREKITLQEMRSFLIVFIAGICLYVPMIVYRLNCSDGNLCGILYRSHPDYDWEDFCGRYLLKYVAHMKSMFVFSWLAVICGLFFMVLGNLLICRILRIRTTSGILISGMFIIVSPCFTETFSYYFAADAYLACFPLAACAVYLLSEKQDWKRMLAAAFCLFLLLAFYQAYLFVAIVLFLFVFIRDLLDNVKSWREIRRGLLFQLGSGVIGIVLYFMINKVFQLMGLIVYQGERFHFGEIFNLSVLPGVIAETWINFFRYYFTMSFLNNGWKARYLVNGLYLLLGGLLLISLVCKKKRTWENRLGIFAAVFILPLAFMGISVLDWQEGAPRIIMLPAAVLFYTGIWALWVREREEDGNIRKLCGWGIYAATFYLIMIMSVYIAIYQLCMKYYVDKTDSMAQRIITRIENTYPETVAGSPVFICGDVDEGVYPQDYRIEQASYIMKGTQACDGMFIDNMQGYFGGWNAYMRYNFGVEYEMVWDKGQELYASDFYKNMPLWPEEGSVAKTEDGIVIVKLKN